jgi:hypothetical protein
MCNLCESKIYRPRFECRTAFEYWMRIALADPREFAYTAPRRIACRLLRHHNVTCRGRMDHERDTRSSMRW